MRYSIETLTDALGPLGSFISRERINGHLWNWAALDSDLRELGYVYGFHRSSGPEFTGWFNVYEHKPGDIIRDDASNPLRRLANLPKYEDRVTGHCTEAVKVSDVLWRFDIQMLKADTTILHSLPIFIPDHWVDTSNRNLHEIRSRIDKELRRAIDRVRQGYMSTTRGLPA